MIFFVPDCSCQNPHYSREGELLPTFDNGTFSWLLPLLLHSLAAVSPPSTAVVSFCPCSKGSQCFHNTGRWAGNKPRNILQVLPASALCELWVTWRSQESSYHYRRGSCAKEIILMKPSLSPQDWLTGILRDCGACFNLSWHYWIILSPSITLAFEHRCCVLFSYELKQTKEGRNNNFPHYHACKNTRLHSWDLFGAHTDTESVLGVENGDVPVASVDAFPATHILLSLGSTRTLPIFGQEVTAEQSSWSLILPEGQRRRFQSPAPVQVWHCSSAPRSCCCHELCFKTSWASHMAVWFTKPLRYWVSLVNHFNYFTKQVMEIDQLKIWHLGLQCCAFIMERNYINWFRT